VKWFLYELCSPFDLPSKQGAYSYHKTPPVVAPTCRLPAESRYRSQFSARLPRRRPCENRTNSEFPDLWQLSCGETMNLRLNLNMCEAEHDDSIPLTGRSSLRSGGRSVTKCDTLTQTHAHTHTHTHTHTHAHTHMHPHLFLQNVKRTWRVPGCVAQYSWSP